MTAGADPGMGIGGSAHCVWLELGGEPRSTDLTPLTLMTWSPQVHKKFSDHKLQSTEVPVRARAADRPILTRAGYATEPVLPCNSSPRMSTQSMTHSLQM